MEHVGYGFSGCVGISTQVIGNAEKGQWKNREFGHGKPMENDENLW